MRLWYTMAALLAGCSQEVAPPTGNGPPPDPVIAVDRDPLIVASTVGTRTTFTLQVIDRGQGALQIDVLRIAATFDGGLPAQIDGGGVFDQPVITVDGGASDALPVSLQGTPAFVSFDYQPKNGGATRLKLFIGSNDPANPQLGLSLTGCGVWPDGGSDTTACTCTDGGC
ncbi:MAG TPA: hypothetical protein VLW85_01955 [Myxococcales bacterium]|nr:hypothetical protein [Myxococcales bacterium]